MLIITAITKDILMKKTKLGEFEELVLLTVVVLQDMAYGVEIKRELEARLNESLSVGSIQSALKRMEEKGFVESLYGGITNERGGRRKKYYVITALGKRVLDQQYDLRTRIYQKIPKISLG